MKIKEDPIYQVMPDLPPDQYEDLKEDIKEHGVMIPIEVDEEGNILDGYNRVKICRELGITDFPVTVRKGWTEEEKYEHALRLNVRRRHLSGEQLKKVILDFKANHPDVSDRQVAQAVGVSPHTVASADTEEFADGQIAHVQNVKGADGKSYPSSEAQAEQQRQKIRDTIKNNPNMSTHQIAQYLGVSDHTVKKQREKLQTGSKQSSNLPSSGQENRGDTKDAYSAPYTAFSKEELEMLLQDEVKSEDQWLHFLLEDFDEHSEKGTVLFSEDGLKTALDGLADLKKVIEKYEVLLNDRNPHK